MLKKARSFRDDLKVRIKRRPSTGVQQMIPQDVKGQVQVKVKPNKGENEEEQEATDDVSYFFLIEIDVEEKEA